MTSETQNKQIEQIKKLEQFLPKEKQETLTQILAFGEKIKVEGEKKKNEFWKYRDRSDFMNLLEYKWNHKKEIEGKYKYLDTMKGIEREKFIEEYLHDDMLYTGEIDKDGGQINGRSYGYKDWKDGNAVIEEGIFLNFENNGIGDDGAKAIAERLRLKRGITLDLILNGIGDDGAEAIAESLRLKKGVTLDLSVNEIGDKGAKAIAERLKLKECVTLNLSDNKIGNDGVRAIVDNMKLKEGVTLDLGHNKIRYEGAEALPKMELKEGVSLNLSGNIILNEGAELLSKMKLKEGVYLNLTGCGIGKKGIRALINNLEMKNGVVLDLSHNDVTSEDLIWEVRDWESSCKSKGINCEIKI